MAPTVAEYLAATQLVQTVEAVDAEYLPAPQLTQVEAVVARTAAENMPATQLVQTVETVDAEYLLVTQLGVVVGRGGVGRGGVGRGGVCAALLGGWCWQRACTARYQSEGTYFRYERHGR